MRMQSLSKVAGRIWSYAVAVIVVALILIAAEGQGTLAAQGIIYVDADATGADDGSSWDDAYTDLQPALTAAASGDEIWVAAGIYKPTSQTDPLDPRTATYQLASGVAIYGGFAGMEIQLEQRDWLAHETVLSGDIGVAGDSADNTYHVVTGSRTDKNAVLDGFTISDGKAEGDFPQHLGGGMFIDAGSPTLSNLIFSGNSARFGGGMLSVESSPALTGCTFSNNSALFGGGMLNSESAPTLTDCKFDSNSAQYEGGGMGNWTGSNPWLANVIFSGNSAGSNGGGMKNRDGSSPTLIECAFVGNTAGGAGGMSNQGSSPTLVNVTFDGNWARGGSGGMRNSSHSSPRLVNVTFSGNSCGFTGGGMGNHLSSPELINCTFSGNEAASAGGGIYNDQSSPVLTNCILWGDTAGGLPNEIAIDDSLPVVTPSSPVVTYSDVQGGYPGRRNINADPQFVDPDNGDYRLGVGSPCIDAGDNTAPDLPDYDFEGDDRILDGDGIHDAIVDMGVDEFMLSLVEVEVDITPSTPSNVVQLGPGPDVPVAILTTGEFDAASVDPGTVVFAGAKQQDWSLVDVDGDGDYDLLLLTFDPRHLELDVNDREATLTGETFDGRLIEGTDRVKVKE